MLNRRDLFKAGAVAALGASAAEAANPFEGPTATFDKKKLEELPDWAFSKELPLPPTPRPTKTGQFEEIHDQPHVFGPDDPVPVGDCFHGVAVEWGATPKHWEMYGCDPNETDPVKSWKDKQQAFGKIANFRGDGEVGNWGGFPVKCYRINIQPELVPLIPELPDTRMYTYGGCVPGPTLRLRHGQPVVIRYHNRLESEVSVHLHGGHSPSHSDGFPTFYVLQGKSRDYFYPNIIPLKLGSNEPDKAEAQSTMWYHDHGMDATGYNVSKGLAGFALFFSEDELRLIAKGVLPGLGEASCIDPELHGPSNAPDIEDPERPGFYAYGKEPYHNPYDLPLVVQDKVIDKDTGQIAFTTAGHNGYLGDSLLVNGAPLPYKDVENRKYRLRILNGSNARVYHLRILREADFWRSQQVGLTQEELIDKSVPFLRIGKDSWLWEKAEQVSDVLLAMANRADLVVDFGYHIGKDLGEGETERFYLVNTMPQTDGRGPKQELQDPGDPRVLPLPFGDGVAELRRPLALMRFDVTGKRPERDATVEHGTELIKREKIKDEEVVAVREFIFERGKGAWQINGRFYDPTIANATPTIGTAEEWVLRNGGGGWWHPIHIHLESHQIVKYEKDFIADGIVDVGDPPDQPALNNLEDVTPLLLEGDKIGYHDTQVLGPNTVVRVRLRFRTFHGPFVFHCHNLEHEDMRMMFNFEPTARSQPPSEDDVNLANVAPDSRTHGNPLTWEGYSEENKNGAWGELHWETPPVPYTPVRISGENVIPPRDTDGH
ncbi:MAG: multicopper oxidase domain-containing protein [Planctomycetaceae bacterium]